MTSKLAIRPLQDQDLAYVINSWMKTGRHSDRHSYMSNDDYRDYFKAHVIQLLAQPSTNVSLIHIEDEPDYILGFLVHAISIQGHLVIHHVQVRRDFWRMGLAKRLIAEVYPDLTKPIVCTQFGKLLPRFLNHYTNLSYNPYVVLASNKEAS